MSIPRYSPEFKEEAIKQVTERGHSVADVGARLGVSSRSLYNWVGYYAAQMATLAGARVFGTVDSSARAPHAQTAGVKESINYKTEAVAACVAQLTDGRGVNAVIDMDFSSTARLRSEVVLAAHGVVVC